MSSVDLVLEEFASVDDMPTLSEIAEAIQIANELAAHLPIDVRDSFLKVINRFAHLPEPLAEIVGVDADGLAASSANERRLGVRLNLPNGYRSFVLALRARNIEVAFEHARKILSPEEGAKSEENARSQVVK